MQLGYAVRAFAQPRARFSAFKTARRGLQAGARVARYLQGNVPAAHVFAHPLLRRKRQWTLVMDPDDPLQRLPDVCVVDKHSKFSLKDAEFAYELFEQMYASEEASDQKRSMSLVLRSDDVCYKALAYLRSKGIQLISPKSIEPTPASAAAAAAATNTDQPRRAASQARKPKVDVSDVRVTKEFKLRAPFTSSTYQDTAVDILAEGVLQKRRKFQTLMGATGTGKTFMMGKVIEKVQRPTLVLAPNKLLAAQLYDEMKALFPENAVEFFVSYYDYFLPEAYISSSDTYIDKVVDINYDIDRLRHSATRSLVERSDVIVVASVSCIYGLGLPQDYVQQATRLSVGKEYKLNELVDTLISLAYKPSPSQPTTGEIARGFFHVQIPAAAGAGSGSRGVITIGPSADEASISLTVDVSRHGGELASPATITIQAISRQDPNAASTEQGVEKLEHVVLYPATHHVMSEEDKHTILQSIQEELDARFEQLVAQQKYLEAERLRQRTESDLMMLQAVGYCKGIENYSRHLTRRAPGEAPACLLDYFPNDWLLLVDESHISVPQVQGMYAGDRARKLNLVKHGFRLPSALDNRPLTASEFWSKVGQCVFVSATPGSNEAIRCTTTTTTTSNSATISSHEATGSAATTGDRPSTAERVWSSFTPTWGAVSSEEAAAFLRNEVAVQNRWWDAEVVIRPTGILDPQVEIRPSSNQLAELMQEIQDRRAKGERVLITAITKAMAEDLAAYINEQGYRASYLHSSIKPMERLEILRSLREGNIDAVVGVNLLREGLNLPEVSLVVILDADKEGFLRSDTSLIQTIGRASRHVEGKVIMYADIVTDSMRRAISETNRRRSIQAEYNRIRGITPRTAHLAPTENQLLTMIEHSVKKGKSALNMDRVAARLHNEEAYNLSEEEDLMRDFPGLQSSARELTPAELHEWQAQIEAKLQEVVADRKYELAMCLVRLRELCKQRQVSASATASSM